MPELGRVLSGARARLLLNGQPLLYCTSVNYSEEIQQDPIEVLDSLPVAEFVATAYRCTFSAQWVRVVTSPIKNREGLVIFPRLKDILTTPELTGAIEDSVTGEVLATIHRVKATRYTMNIGARGIVLTDAEFVCISIEDESEISA